MKNISDKKLRLLSFAVKISMVLSAINWFLYSLPKSFFLF